MNEQNIAEQLLDAADMLVTSRISPKQKREHERKISQIEKWADRVISKAKTGGPFEHVFVWSYINIDGARYKVLLSGSISIDLQDGWEDLKRKLESHENIETVSYNLD